MSVEITRKFVEDNIEEILSNLRPDLTFEYFSKRTDGWLNSNGWNIKITSNENEILSEYQNGKLVSGYWFEYNLKNQNMEMLYKTLKLKAKKIKLDFHKYLNKLLCQGKPNGGISWLEYDAVHYIEKLIILSKKEDAEMKKDLE